MCLCIGLSSWSGCAAHCTCGSDPQIKIASGKLHPSIPCCCLTEEIHAPSVTFSFHEELWSFFDFFFLSFSSFFGEGIWRNGGWGAFID